MTLTATRLDLAALNAMDRDAFVAAVGPTFENSPWVAQAAWARRPFADTDALHAAMLDVVREAPLERRIAFLRGHPELAGREAALGLSVDHFDGELVAHHARIIKEGLVALVDVIVGAANADAHGLHQHFAGTT